MNLISAGIAGGGFSALDTLTLLVAGHAASLTA